MNDQREHLDPDGGELHSAEEKTCPRCRQHPQGVCEQCEGVLLDIIKAE